MLSQLTKRNSGRCVVVEFNPYQILIAEVTRPPRGPYVIEAAGEFNREDIDGLRRWIESKDDGRKLRVNAIAGLVPHRGIVQRESVLPERLSDPGYLEEVVEEQQRGRFLSATPFKIIQAKTWTMRALGAVDGTAVPASGPSQPALICAISNAEVLAVQQRLIDSRLSRERLEPGLLSLFGAVYRDIARRGGTQAVVIVVIHQSATATYILGKEGVHTPTPILHGLDSIIEAGRKELGEIDEAEVMAELHRGNPDLIKHSAKLVRRIGRDLKPVVDSFEMTTGQPVDEILCAYLPANLQWLAEPLARAIGRTPMVVDHQSWMPAAGVQVAPNGPTFGPHWLGALSLIADLADYAPAKHKSEFGDGHGVHRPWHVDCSVPLESDERGASGRRLLAGAIALSIAGLVVLVTTWQAYVTYSLKADTRFWEQQMSGSRKLFEELNSASATLKNKTAVLDHAYVLAAETYLHSNLFVHLGRLTPARMRVDRIETNDARVAISGTVLEPAEDAAVTLGRHMDEIRRHPELGPLFSQISITSLQRKINSEFVTFELTLRLKRSTP